MDITNLKKEELNRLNNLAYDPKFNQQSFAEFLKDVADVDIAISLESGQVKISVKVKTTTCFVVEQLIDLSYFSEQNINDILFSMTRNLWIRIIANRIEELEMTNIK